MARNITMWATVVLLSVGTARAQFAPAAVNVKVPFEFTVGKKTFPAGQYWIGRVAPNALALRDSKQRVLTLMPTVPLQAVSARSTPVLRFRTENGHHVLAEVWLTSSRYGYQTSRPQQAVALAQRDRQDTSTAAETRIPAQ